MPVVTDYTALLSGDYWNGIERTGPVFLTYSFPTSAPAAQAAVMGAAASTFQTYSVSQQAAAVAALNQWASVCGIVAIEVAPGQGDINFGLYNFTGTAFSGSGGIAFNPFGDWHYQTFQAPNQYAFFNSSGDGVTDASGDVFINSAFLSGGVIPTGLLLHEIGHALGFKHVGTDLNNIPLADNVVYSGTILHDQTLGAALDNTNQTVLSYHAGSNPNVLGTFDVQAAQAIYGTNAQDGSHVASWSFNAGTQTLTQTGFDGVNDVMRGISVADSMAGGTGDDQLYGMSGNDTLSGGGGLDTLWGGTGNDTLTGGAGNDVFHLDLFDPALAQSDVITDFVAGQDKIDLSQFASGSFLAPATFAELLAYAISTDGSGNAIIRGKWNGNFQTTTLTGIAAASLSAVNFNFYDFGPRTTNGSAGADMVFGGSSADSLSGGAGTDTLVGGAGDDTLSGGAAAAAQTNVVDGGAGNDTATYAGLIASIYADLNTGGGFIGGVLTDIFTSIENVIGGDGGGTLNGNGGGNRFTGGAGDDLIFGNGGNDTLTGGGHALGSFNQLFGGLGVDTADYSAATGKVFVDLRAPAGHIDTGSGYILNDLMNSIENVLGSANDDILIGTDADANLLMGGAGTDLLFGFGANDTLVGGSANAAQYNQLWAGLGSDTASYAGTTAGVYADLNVLAGWVRDGVGALILTDVYNSVENLTGGSGDDVLVGEDSVNIIEGGIGADQLYGRGGADTFVYRAYAESNVVTGYDTIADFVTGSDRIDLTAFATTASHVIITSANGATKLLLEQTPGTFNGATDLAIAFIGTNALVLGDVLL